MLFLISRYDFLKGGAMAFCEFSRWGRCRAEGRGGAAVGGLPH